MSQAAATGSAEYPTQSTDPARILYPLTRSGERGEGKWERVTWDEALDDIAAREDEVMAFAFMNADGAREQADAATARYRAGRALSPVDGLRVKATPVAQSSPMLPNTMA